jgi:hypothetical protein
VPELIPPLDVPPPSSGLGSNSNYILASNCNPLLGLSVTIDVTEDIVCKSASGATKGFSFQLNAYSPTGQTSAFQQYVMALFGNELTGSVDNWPLSGPNIINDFFDLAQVPKSQTLPAGYVLQMGLLTNGTWRTSWDLAVAGGWAGPGDCGLLLYERPTGTGTFYGINSAGGLYLIAQYDNSVYRATYQVVDNEGRTLANVTKDLSSLSGGTGADLAPVIAFELNLVGPVNGESAQLSSGAGTIVYAAATPLTVLDSEPPCAEAGFITAETANSV